MQFEGDLERWKPESHTGVRSTVYGLGPDNSAVSPFGPSDKVHFRLCGITAHTTPSFVRPTGPISRMLPQHGLAYHTGRPCVGLEDLHVWVMVESELDDLEERERRLHQQQQPQRPGSRLGSSGAQQGSTRRTRPVNLRRPILARSVEKSPECAKQAGMCWGITL